MNILKNQNANFGVISAFFSLIITFSVMMVMLIAFSPAINMVLNLFTDADLAGNRFYSDWLGYCVTTSFSWWAVIPIIIVVMGFIYLIFSALRKQSGSQESVRRDEF